MALTVSAAFDAFHGAINLGGDHREVANSRKETLLGYLKKSFDVLDAFAIGSIPKYTALKGDADLDIMVVLHYTKHIKDKTPKQLLQDVQTALAEYRTNVRKNGQAVTLYYQTWPFVDVVPVARHDNSDGTVSHYILPNANNGTWLSSRPKHFAEAIEKRSTDSGYNFRRIIKMIKVWNNSHSCYLSSYHIEVLALQVLTGNLDDTPWQVSQFFEKSRPLLASSLYYDVGYVDGYLSYTDRTEVLKRFDRAKEQSLEAWYLGYQSPSNTEARD